jgi:hypothetical protein
MAAATVETAPPAPELPDYMTDPNATLNDKDASWRFGRAPDYTNTRRVYEESKCSLIPSHVPPCLNTQCSMPILLIKLFLHQRKCD